MLRLLVRFVRHPVRSLLDLPKLFCRFVRNLIRSLLALRGLFRRTMMYLGMVLLGYLLQVCVMPYLKVFGVTPNLLYVIIGIITVAYGKLRAFWAGIVFAMLTQIMLPSVSYLNLGLYSLTTLFCSFPFADKPLKTIEYERATNRHRKELPAWLRTLLCTLLNVFVYETVQVTYIYLGGSPLTLEHFLRALIDVAATGLLCLALMFPLRRGIFGRRMDAPEDTIAPVVFSQR